MNITTLNTTTLDGNVIIKKGVGVPPPPPSGGDVLEGEYYLVKPNGWFWKFTEEFHAMSTLNKVQITSELFLIMGTMYEQIHQGYGGNYKSEIKLCFRDIGMLQYVANKNIEDAGVISGWVACMEGGPTKILLGETQGEYESIFHAANSLVGEMTEEDFEAMMLDSFKLQRITKEEYEALITA